MALDFNKAAKSLLLDLINTKATRPLTEQELQFGTPAASSEHSKNTVIQLDAAAEAENLQGSQQFYYDRLALSDVFADAIDDVTFQLPHGTDSIKASELVSKLVTKFGLASLTGEIQEETFQLSAGTVGQVTLTAIEGGLVYTGTLQVALTYAAAPKDNLATVLADNVAEGFVKPTVSVVG
ncbi:hypothetical protein ACQCZE_20715 [Escherichia coli]|uniref:DUF7941 domain-family protein n=1 Tax=Escherichia coli TaxID=562 RepID=UPI003CEEBD84